MERKYIIKNVSLILFIIISFEFLVVSADKAYDAHINQLAKMSAEYITLSDAIDSISADKPENLNIALSDLEIMTSDTHMRLMSQLLNTEVKRDDMKATNNAYSYLLQNYDKIKSGYANRKELSKLASDLRKIHAEGYEKLGKYIYKYNGNIFGKSYFLVIGVMLKASDEYNSYCSSYAAML